MSSNYLYDINLHKSKDMMDLTYWDASISTAWHLFFTPGHCLELRAFYQGKVLSGFYDDAECFCNTAKYLSGRCDGVFVTQNPVPRSLLSLYPKNTVNCNFRPILHEIDASLVSGHIATTADADIELETSMVIDVDPIRKGGISATDEELAASYLVATHVMYFLDCRMLPNYLACSGNGWHVIMLCEPQKVNEKTVRNRRHLLQLLADKFNTEDVEIDQKVFNLARIIKLYGTMSRKGRNDIENNRLHRISYVIGQSAYDRYNFHSEFTEDFKNFEVTNTSHSYSRHQTYDIEAILAASRIGYRRKKDGLWELENCPSAPDGHKPFEACVTQQPSGAVGFSCFHNRCKNYTWRDFKKYLERECNVNLQEHMK